MAGFTLSVVYINRAAHLTLLTTTFWSHFVRTPTPPLFIDDTLTVYRDTSTMSSAATRKVVHSLSPARRVPDMRGAAKQASVAVKPIRLPYKQLQRSNKSTAKPRTTLAASRQNLPPASGLTSRTRPSASATRVP